MTNREAFNKYLRDEIEEKIRAVERMGNQELMDRLGEYPDFKISSEIKRELNYFWFTKIGKKPDWWEGSKSMVKWLDEEAREKT